MDTNRVLWEIMVAGAKEAVAKLRANHLAVEPELVKADAVIRRKELIGR